MSSDQFVQLKLKLFYFVRIIRNSTVYKIIFGTVVGFGDTQQNVMAVRGGVYSTERESPQEHLVKH